LECQEILTHKAAHPRILEPSAMLPRECHFVVTFIIPFSEPSTNDIKLLNYGMLGEDCVSYETAVERDASTIKCVLKKGRKKNL